MLSGSSLKSNWSQTLKESTLIGEITASRCPTTWYVPDMSTILCFLRTSIDSRSYIADSLMNGTGIGFTPTRTKAGGTLTIFQMIFQMMMILIDNAELYMYKEILYCDNLVCAP